MEAPKEDTELAPSVSFLELVAWNFMQTTAKGLDERYKCLNCGCCDIKKSGSNGNLMKHCSNSTCFGTSADLQGLLGSSEERREARGRLFPTYLSESKADGDMD